MRFDQRPGVAILAQRAQAHGIELRAEAFERAQRGLGRAREILTGVCVVLPELTHDADPHAFDVALEPAEEIRPRASARV